MVGKSRAGERKGRAGLSRKARKKSGDPGEVSKVTPKNALELGCSGAVRVGGADQLVVVGLGASAGGLEALRDFFEAQPSDGGMVFVVVIHQRTGRKSLVPGLVGRWTRMPVLEARDRMRLARNTVYIAPPDVEVAIEGRCLRVRRVAVGRTPYFPIDGFFHSLGAAVGPRAVCVVLSGTGTDGTLGLKAVKAEGGMAMVQELRTARYTGMPGSAIATSLADYVLPAGDMPPMIISYVNGLRLTQSAGVRQADVNLDSQALAAILNQLRMRTGHDFSLYKMGTIRRRVMRRMAVHQLKELERYVGYMHDNPHEADILLRELLIGVTRFFRDPEAFASLSKGPLRELVRARRSDYTFRAWVPGCSTGEEAYSIAMILRELVPQEAGGMTFQIFGTDLDRRAIEVARAGRYSWGIGADVEEARLDRFFVRQESSYQVCKGIRDMLVFAEQNIVSDPPFTKLDLICSRNLLIYFSSELQRRLIPLFHYALKPGGLLMLGASESVGAHTELFEAVDKKWKIYRRCETPLDLPLPEIPTLAGQRLSELAEPGDFRKGVSDPFVQTAERYLARRFAPASAIVNDSGNILYIHGRIGAYLEPDTGEPRWRILHMAREGLRSALCSALRLAATPGKTVPTRRVRVQMNGGHQDVELSVVRIDEPETLRGLLLVSFTPCPEPRERRKARRSGADASVGGLGEDPVTALEQELQNSKASLQTTIEELEVANEEMKSTNEELQSTIEELETSKEEMQSLNEELATVNAELQCKVDELSHTNDDMQNLLNATDVATMFLDRNMKIERYTEKARRLVSLIESDIGRPVADLAVKFRNSDLSSEAARVLETLSRSEREVQTDDGSWYLMRMMPYRTAGNVIDGVVVTFVDIGRVKEAELAAARARTFCEVIFDGIACPLLVLDYGLRVLSENAAFRSITGDAPDAMHGRHVYDIGSGVLDCAELRRMLASVPEAGSSIEGTIRIGPAKREYVVSVRRMNEDGAGKNAILLSMADSK